MQMVLAGNTREASLLYEDQKGLNRYRLWTLSILFFPLCQKVVLTCRLNLRTTFSRVWNSEISR